MTRTTAKSRRGHHDSSASKRWPTAMAGTKIQKAITVGDHDVLSAHSIQILQPNSVPMRGDSSKAGDGF